MQTELFGDRGRARFLALLVCQTGVFASGSLALAARWAEGARPGLLPRVLVDGLLWIFCGALIALILLLWDAVSVAASRLVTPRWPRIFWRGIAPCLVLGALAVAIAASRGDPARPDALLVAFVLAIGAIATAVHAGLAFALATKLARIRDRDGEWRRRVAALREAHGRESFARVELSRALLTGEAPGDPRPAPPALVGLTARPWHDTRGLPWVAALEANFAAIRAEALAVLAAGPPAGRALSGSGGEAGLCDHHYPGVGAHGWQSFRFVVTGQPIEANCARCPRTSEALKALPRYPHFVESMFSVMRPGGAIAPHRDILNVWLTCHLPLIVPDGCGIRVGGIPRKWEEGRVLLFDASYEHEAWNHSDEPRVVLLTDILHPEVTDAEAALMQWFHWTRIP